MKKKSRVDQLFDKLKAYLKPTLEEAVAERNSDDPDLYLENIKEWDRGYRDVLAGLSEYPAILFIVSSRSQLDSFTVRYSAEISIALKGNENLAEQGEAYTDILWDAVVADCHLGETCLDSSDLVIETGMIGSVFLVVATVDLEVDEGGFV